MNILNFTNLSTPQVEDRIKEIAENKGVSLQWIAEQIGMTKQGFYYTLNNKTIKVETVRKISDLLQIPLVSFFLNKSDADSLQKELNNKKNTGLADVLSAVVLAFAVYNYAKNHRDIVEKAKTDESFTKEDMIRRLEDHVNMLEDVLKKMNDINSMNDDTEAKSNQ